MGKMSEIEYDSRQVSSLVYELRSYPQHYVAAHRAADRIEKLEDALLSIIAKIVDGDICIPAKAALEGKDETARKA